jgi:tetratricopeptide (TPR) repeat protein
MWRAARVFFEEAAATGPLMLVLDDLHAADDILLDFVDELADQLPPVPLLLVATARPELLRRRSGWAGGKRNATTISLTTLSDAGTAHLLRILLSRYGLSEKDVETGPDGEFWPDLVARIGGNPRFAEEYVRMLAESPAGGSLGPLRLPESVRAVLAARLDTLPAEERAVLLDASVFGMVLWPGAVAAVSGRGVEEVRRCLESLARREILTRARRSSVAGEPEYTFGQVLTREIAYERLPLDARAARHRLAATWIERLPVDHAESLAHHYGTAVALAAATGRPTAELSGRARAVLAGTGKRAEAMGARRAAARCFRAALELCPANDHARPELLLGYGKSLADGGGVGGEVVLIEARDALLVSGDIVGAASAEFQLAQVADRRDGELGSRVRRDRALALVKDAEGADAAAMRCALAMSLVIDGRCEDARELADRALAAADRLDRPDLQLDALKARGAARVDLGDLDGIGDLRRAVRMCADQGRPTTRALGNLSCGLARAGLLGELADVRAEGTVAAAKYADIVATRMLRGTAVTEHYWAGEWGQALEQAARLLVEFGPDWLPLRASWHTVRGRNALSEGDVAGAEKEARLGLVSSRRLNDPQDLCPTLAFAARAALAGGRSEEAGALAEELLRLLAGRTMLPDIGADLPIVLAGLGYTERALDDIRPSPWRAAAITFLSGNPEEAAEAYRRIGSRPDELQARMAVRAEV